MTSGTCSPNFEEFRANDGKLSGRFENSPILLLTTTGARTGLGHTTYGCTGWTGPECGLRAPTPVQ